MLQSYVSVKSALDALPKHGLCLGPVMFPEFEGDKDEEEEDEDEDAEEEDVPTKKKANARPENKHQFLRCSRNSKTLKISIDVYAMRFRLW